MTGRRVALFVLTVWLAVPAGRLVCAMSCAQPPLAEQASSHCHEAASTPSGDTRIDAGHACPDPGSFGLNATVKARHISLAAALFAPLPHGTSAGRGLAGSEPPTAPGNSRPPDGLLVPLRL